MYSWGVPVGCKQSSQLRGTAARTFSFRLQGEPETLDWNRAHTPIETYLLVNLMEGLISLDSNLKSVPALAKSWDVSADGKTYTFRLRTDVKWSDGALLEAQHFVDSWERLLSPETAAPYAYLLYDIVGAQDFNHRKSTDFRSVGVRAIDRKTLQVQLLRPVPYWLSLLSFWVTFPVRKDLIQKYGKDWEKPGNLVTLGPYVLSSRELESRIVLKSNPNYYGSHGNVEQAIGWIVRDDSTALKLYESGRLDFLADLSTLDLKRLNGRADLQIFPYLKTVYLGFVLTDPLLKRVHLRRAVSMAIDKSQISQILSGGQEGASSFVPKPLSGFSRQVGLPYDPKEAQKEIQMARSLGPVGPIEFLIPSWDKSMILAQFVQSELKKNLGLEVVIQSFDIKTYRSQINLRKFPMFLSSWSADYPDPDNFLSVFTSHSGNNRTAWSNSEFDRWVENAKTISDQKKRERVYLDLQKVLLERDGVIVPLYYEPSQALVRPRVQGLELNPLNYLMVKTVSLP